MTWWKQFEQNVCRVEAAKLKGEIDSSFLDYHTLLTSNVTNSATTAPSGFQICILQRLMTELVSPSSIMSPRQRWSQPERQTGGRLVGWNGLVWSNVTSHTSPDCWPGLCTQQGRWLRCRHYRELGGIPWPGPAIVPWQFTLQQTCRPPPSRPASRPTLQQSPHNGRDQNIFAKQLGRMFVQFVNQFLQAGCLAGFQSSHPTKPRPPPGLPCGAAAIGRVIYCRVIKLIARTRHHPTSITSVPVQSRPDLSSAGPARRLSPLRVLCRRSSPVAPAGRLYKLQPNKWFAFLEHDTTGLNNGRCFSYWEWRTRIATSALWWQVTEC